MRALTRFAVISLAGLSMAACTDRTRHFLGPNVPLDAPTHVIFQGSHGQGEERVSGATADDR